MAVQGRLDRVMALIEARRGEADYLAGNEFTAADIMSVVSLNTMRLFQPVDLRTYSTILAYFSGSARGQPTAGRWQKRSRPDADADLTIRPAMFGPCG
jgi:glutathione S-transferase